MGICTNVPAAEQPELWRKAVKIVSESRWLPGEIHVHEQIFNKKGKLEEDNESFMQLQAGEKGEILAKVVKILKNGKETDENTIIEANSDMAMSMTFEELAQMEENPFLSEIQAQIDITPLEEEKTIEGVRCLAFRYAHDARFALISEAQDFRFEGVAWLAEDSGAPYELEYELTQGLPVKEEGLTITSVNETTRYAYSKDGDWYALENVSDSEFEMKVTLMIFKGRSHEVSTYSRHWKYRAID